MVIADYIFCKNCGKKNDFKSECCIYCGYQLRQKKDKKTTEPIKEEKDKNNSTLNPKDISKDIQENIVVKKSINSYEKKRIAYQYIQIRVQLLGRGMTNEIMNLYVNGKRLKPTRIKTLHEFLNYLGSQGFQVVTAEIETEGVYTHFYTLQRQVFTSSKPTKDIYQILEETNEGADFGDSVRNLLEFSLFDH